MSVSVIVVTWNGLRVLQNCVAALARQSVEHELIIVDNDSVDGTAHWLAAHAPQAKVIGLPRNLGFAGGNNVGLRAATGEYLVLLNNDTIPAPNFVERLVAPLAADDHLGTVAGVLTFAHRPELVAAAGIVAGRDGLHRELWAMQPVATLPDAPVEIFGASGGAIGLRRRALLDVGLFDEGYFAYLEDADLAWRLRLRGWRCVVAPDARVRHIYSATSGQGSPFKQWLLARNRLRLIVRCYSAGLLRRYWPAIVGYDLLAIAYGIVRGQPAMISGRIAVLRELPQLIAARRTIHARRIVADEALERWLHPPITIRAMLAEQHALNAVVQRRAQ